MKIAYIVTKYPVLTETFLKREIESLRRSGLTITIFAAGTDTPERNSDKKNTIYRPALISKKTFRAIKYTLRKYPCAPLKILIFFLKALLVAPADAKTIFANYHTICHYIYYLDKYRISHIHAYFINWPACIGLAIAKVTKKPLSIAAHARDLFVEKSNLKEKTKNAQFIVACSGITLNHLRMALPKQLHNKLYLNHHGINTNSEILKQKIQRKNNILIAVGRLVPKKGFANLLHAFAIVRRSHPNILLVIIGDGALKNKLLKLTEKLNLNRNVLMLGRQKNNTTIKLIKNAKILLVPSIIDSQGDRDGIPNIIFEAFAAKTPVIASRMTGFDEIIEDNHNGIMCRTDDKKIFAKKINQLLSDQMLQNKLIKNAFFTVNENFNCDKNCSKLRKLFRYADES